MATRKCRMTDEQKKIHSEAVRLRKMTDEQLINYMNQKGSGPLAAHEVLRTFCLWLGKQKGYGPKTIQKIEVKTEEYINAKDGLNLAETLKRKKGAKHA